MTSTVSVLNRNKNLFLFGLGVLIFGIHTTIQERITESRQWRDLTMSTPFYDVRLLSMNLKPEGLEISGTFIKRRCIFHDASAYVKIDDTWYKTTMDDHTSNNRAPLKEPQRWGPRVILWSGLKPSYWVLEVEHKCPDETDPESNLFISGAWPDTTPLPPVDK
jgi:hypothetical protein